MDRLVMLRSMVAQRPGDPFAHYGLAMELTKREQFDDAAQTFAALVEAHPDYVATYLMYGNLLVKMGRAPDAGPIYDRGVDAAQRAGDEHTVSELLAARAQL